MRAHGAVASIELGDEVARTVVLADWRAAKLRPPVAAMLGFLEKLVREPDALTAADAEAVRAAGVPDEGLRTAIQICGAFTVITRIADTFQFDLPDEDGFRAIGRNLMKRGYMV